MMPERRTQWAVVAAAVLGGIVAALHVGKVPPALPLIQTELGLDLVAGGFVVSVFNVLGMVLALVVGATADRLGRGRLVTGGFLCLLIGGVLGAFAEGLAMLLISRFVEGIGFIAVIVALPAVVLAAAAGRDRPLALSLWSIFMPVGMMLGLLIAPLVLATAGWRGMWVFAAVLSVVALVAVARAVGRVALPPPPPGPPLLVVGEVAARPGLLLLGTAFGAYAFQWVSLMVWLPTFLAHDLAATGTTAAILTALVIALNVPGNILSGWLLRRGVSPRSLIALGCLGMAAASLGIFAPVLADGGRLALCLLFSFCGGMVPACLFAGAPAQAPTPGHMGAANGLLMQGSAIGQFIGPPLLAAAVAAAGGAWSGALAPLLAGTAVTLGAGWLATGRAAAVPHPEIKKSAG